MTDKETAEACQLHAKRISANIGMLLLRSALTKLNEMPIGAEQFDIAVLISPTEQYSALDCNTIALRIDAAYNAVMSGNIISIPSLTNENNRKKVLTSLHSHFTRHLETIAGCIAIVENEIAALSPAPDGEEKH